MALDIPEMKHNGTDCATSLFVNYDKAKAQALSLLEHYKERFGAEFLWRYDNANDNFQPFYAVSDKIRVEINVKVLN